MVYIVVYSAIYTMGSKKRKKQLKEQKLKQKAFEQEKIQQKKAGKKQWGYLALILVFAFTCFSPSLNNGFVNWDDDRNFTDNELVTSLNKQNFWENTAKIFKSDVIGGYNPLTVWTFLLENKFFGLDQPLYWHLDNILLHLVCCMFVFWIGLRLGLGNYGTIILTLLFAIQPMRVESVAWVTERKDVLFGAFYLAAMLYYIRGKQEGFKTSYYAIIGLCFILSLFSKIQAVVLPVSLVLVDYYLSRQKTITLKSILNKWLYFIGSLAVGILGIYFLQDEGSTQQVYEGISRIFIGSFSLLIYLVKSVVPYKMSPLYPYPSSLDWYYFVSPISFLLVGWALWRSYFKKYYVWFFGLGFFMVNVVLLLQILGAGQGFLADRFTYIPYIGLFFIMAYFIEQYVKNNPKRKPLVTGLVAAILAIYGMMCFQQNKIWHDSGTLWTHVLKYHTKSTLPWGNRANYYRDEGRIAEALHDYSEVIKLVQDKPEPYNSRAKLYFGFPQRDSLLKALDNYNKAIVLDPDNAEYWTNRGATYAKLGDPNNAVKNFNKAQEFDPNFANLYLNRSVIFNNSGQWQNALNDITKYLELKPYHADMWYEKARLHQLFNDYQGFIDASNRAIQMDPNKALYHYQRANGLHAFKRLQEAKASLNRAMQLGVQPEQEVINKILNQ